MGCWCKLNQVYLNDINVYFINSDLLASRILNLGVCVNCRKLLKGMQENNTETDVVEQLKHMTLVHMYFKLINKWLDE